MPRTLTIKNNNLLVKPPKYEALNIVKCLLSLDTSQEYFQIRVDKLDNSLGNRRLNWMLHLLQIFYYTKYDRLLFADEMIALENGAVVYEIYRYLAENDNKWLLDTLQNVSNVKDAKDKRFIAILFEHFKTHHDKCLESLCKSDPAWFSVWREGKKDPRLDFDSENLKFYKVFCPNRLQWIERTVAH